MTSAPSGQAPPTEAPELKPGTLVTVRGREFVARHDKGRCPVCRTRTLKGQRLVPVAQVGLAKRLFRHSDCTKGVVTL